jgi:hypothetical protein
MHYSLNLTFYDRTWNTIISFFVKEGTSEEHAVTASELALCYHNVKHSIIYNIFNCNTKLSHQIFCISKVGSKLSCKRTKAEALVTNFLAQSTI